jgi:predicted nucleic acid-binding protein
LNARSNRREAGKNRRGGTWIEAGRLLPHIFPDHEKVGLARLQNDCLLALTARYTGAMFVTADGHFATIRRYVSFQLRTVES